MPSVLSVNVGRPRPVDTGQRTVLTAIWKSPVAGRVAVRGVNLDGDDQADRSVHGGPDKAVEEGELGVGDPVEVDVTALPDHGVTMRLVSDAILIDHGLIPQALDAQELIPSLREWMTAKVS